jgi:thiol:disulfide interchange protein
MRLCFFYISCKSIATEVFLGSKGRNFYVCSDCAVEKSYYFTKKKINLSEENEKELFFDDDLNEEERKIMEEIKKVIKMTNEASTREEYTKNEASLKEKTNLLEKTWNERNEKKWREKEESKRREENPDNNLKTEVGLNPDTKINSKNNTGKEQVENPERQPTPTLPHPPSAKQNYWNYIIALFLIGCLVLVGILVNKKKKKKKKKRANKPLANSTCER